MSYCVYKHTTPSGKVYIGITSKNPLKRWARGIGYCGNKHFYNAINKYGWDNIKHEILFDGLSKEEACKKEIELIKQYKSNDSRYGYNRSTGGEYPATGFKHTEAYKKRMSDRMTGRVVTDETRRRMSAANTGNHLAGRIGKDCGKSKKIYQLDKAGNVINVFFGAKEATRVLGFASPSKIGDVCRGTRKTAYGFKWQYAEDT